jgi:hypothetical protein
LLTGQLVECVDVNYQLVEWINFNYDRFI